MQIRSRDMRTLKEKYNKTTNVVNHFIVAGVYILITLHWDHNIAIVVLDILLYYLHQLANTQDNIFPNYQES